MAVDPRRQPAAPKRKPLITVKEREKTTSVDELLRGPVAPETATPTSLFAPKPKSLFAPKARPLFAPRAQTGVFTKPTVPSVFTRPKTSLFRRSVFAPFGGGVFRRDGKATSWKDIRAREGGKRFVRRIVVAPPPKPAPLPKQEHWHMTAVEFTSCFKEHWGPFDFMKMQVEVDFDEAIESQLRRGDKGPDLELAALQLRPDEDQNALFREQYMWDPRSEWWDEIMERIAMLRLHLIENPEDCQKVLDLTQDECFCSRAALRMAGRASSDAPYIDDRWAMEDVNDQDAGYTQSGVAAALLDHIAFCHADLFDGQAQKLAALMLKAVDFDDPPPFIQDIFVFDLGLTTGTVIERYREDRSPRALLRGTYYVANVTYFSAVGVCKPLPAPAAVMGWRLLSLAPIRAKTLVAGYDLECDCGLMTCPKCAGAV